MRRPASTSSRASPSRSGCGEQPGSWPRAEVRCDPRAWSHPSSVGSGSCGCSRSSCTAPARSRRARLLSIVGVAGVGKSRLAWEFFKYVDGLTEKIFWHRGRCLAYGEGVAYSALGEMVRMRAGILENEAADSAREKLRRIVARIRQR